MAILVKLFVSFCHVGLFSIGGGYVAIPLIQEQAVALNGWLTMSQFSDLLTISEMTPGPITLNAATFVGNQVAGFPGALAATLGAIFPSCVIASILAYTGLSQRLGQQGVALASAGRAAVQRLKLGPLHK